MTAFSMKQAALTDCLPQQEQYGSGCRSLKTQIIIRNIFYNIYKKLKAWLVNFWGIFGRTGVLSNLWQNYTASPINYGDGGSLPRSKNNIKDLLIASTLLFLFLLASCHLLPPLGIITAQLDWGAQWEDQTKNVVVQKGGWGHWRKSVKTDNGQNFVWCIKYVT